MNDLAKIIVDDIEVLMIINGDLVIRSLDHGDWEMFTIQTWIDEIRNNKTEAIFDIGAYTGIYTLISGKCGVKNIFSFEPIPQIYSRLKENVDKNLVKAKLLNVGLSNTNDTKIFKATNNTPLTSAYSTEPRLNEIHNRDLTIHVNTLDSFSFPRYTHSVIKIDVEGHELSVLSGSSEFINENKPTVFIELLDDSAFNKVYKFFKERGYEDPKYLNDKEKLSVNCINFVNSGNYVFKLLK